MELSQQDKYEIAKRGIDFQSLKDHPAMVVILEELQQRKEEARKELETADRNNPNRVGACQDTIRMYRELMEIINGFIREGLEMEKQLHEEAQLTE